MATGGICTCQKEKPDTVGEEGRAYKGHVTLKAGEGSIGEDWHSIRQCATLCAWSRTDSLVSVARGNDTLVFGGKLGLASTSRPILPSICNSINIDT